MFTNKGNKSYKVFSDHKRIEEISKCKVSKIYQREQKNMRRQATTKWTEVLKFMSKYCHMENIYESNVKQKNYYKIPKLQVRVTIKAYKGYLRFSN